MQTVTISHASEDAEIAHHVAAMISRSSLKQVDAWFSSDRSDGGGFQPGDRWLDVLRERLAHSAAVIALLTPHSINRPWIYFESGIGAARADLEVMPVLVGLGMSDLGFPLATYQAYQLNDYESAMSFLGKLFHRLKIGFDEEMTGVVVKPLISKLVHPPRDTFPALGDPSATTANIGRLIKHLDYRFFELAEALGDKAPSYRIEYSVPVELTVEGERKRELLKLDQQTRLNAVLGNVFYMLGKTVPPYSYLEKWLLREKNTGERLVVREVQFRIPAHLILWPGSEWEVVYLESSYTGSDSSVDIVRRREERKQSYNQV